jgi:hypothetical protein
MIGIRLLKNGNRGSAARISREISGRPGWPRRTFQL